MYSAFRPAARRLLSIRPNASSALVARSRSISTTQSIAFSRPAIAATLSSSSSSSSIQRIQRRWNSDEALKKATEEKEAVVNNDAAEVEAKSADAAEASIEKSAMKAASEQVSTVTETVTETTTTTAAETESADESSKDDGATLNYVGGRLRRPFENVEPKPTVYVGNLFFDVTAEDLKARMEEFGVVRNCSVINDARGLSKGFGYVTFSTVEAATKAIEGMNQKVYEGRRVIVQYSAAGPPDKVFRSKHEPTRTLYIGNLAYDLSDRELNDIFKSVRNVVEVRVAVDRQTGLPRGFAHADFLDIASAQAAAEALGSKAPRGRRLRIDFTQGTKKVSPRARRDYTGAEEEE